MHECYGLGRRTTRDKTYMANRITPRNLAAALTATGYWICAPILAAAPAAQAPYSLSVFARSASGYSQPDSIVQWKDSILVGFQNHVAKDGSDHKTSTIVQYSLTGQPQRAFSVPGHNDGLRVVGESDLWCLQNEDANPNLVVIDLNSGHQQLYTFPATPHGGGYDDIVVQNGQVFLTASNPNTPGGTNIYPALVRATLHGNTVALDTVLYGNANAVDIPTGATVPLNLTDPDSLTVDPRGNIVLNSQADAELIFIRNALSDQRLVGRLKITTAGGGPTTLDDTAFAPGPHSYMLFSDVAGDVIYRIDNRQFGFEPGTAYSTSDTAAIVGTLNLDNGVITPIATGFGSTRGLIFVKSTSTVDE
jgi:hypothetical protein